MGRPITDVRLRILRAAPSERIAVSFGELRHRSTALVEIECAGGEIGYGESWVNYPAWAADERVATVRDGIAPLLIGQEAGDVGALHERLLAALLPLGRQWGAVGPIVQAVSGADLALWDLAGKLAGRSVGELLGGRVREQVAAYASSLGPSSVAEDAARCGELGFRMVKLKVGFGRDVDEANLRAARRVLGDEIELAVDANQRWTLAEAVAMCGPLNDAAVTWVEEPIAGNELTDLEEFHRRTGLRVATGENVYLRSSFERYAASPGVHVLQPDVTKTGGITGFREAYELAAAAGKSVIPHLYGGAVGYAATLQVAAGCAAVGLVEYDIRSNPLRDPLLVEPPRPEGGVVTIPRGPGLGIELDAVRVSEVER